MFVLALMLFQFFSTSYFCFRFSLICGKQTARIHDSGWGAGCVLSSFSFPFLDFSFTPLSLSSVHLWLEQSLSSVIFRRLCRYAFQWTEKLQKDTEAFCGALSVNGHTLASIILTTFSPFLWAQVHINLIFQITSCTQGHMIIFCFSLFTYWVHSPWDWCGLITS